MKQARGFTLFEILIALAIFSVLSVMAYGGLQHMLSTRQQVQQASDRLAELQLAMLRISNDLRQFVLRPVRDEYGAVLPAMSSGQAGLYLLEFTQGGLSNPGRLLRSQLQRVAYTLEDGTLYRISWPVLDRAQDTQPYKAAILSNISEVMFRFYNAEKQEWSEIWPSQDITVPELSVASAVEVNMLLNDWGSVRRLVILAGGDV